MTTALDILLVDLELSHNIEGQVRKMVEVLRKHGATAEEVDVLRELMDEQCGEEKDRAVAAA